MRERRERVGALLGGSGPPSSETRQRKLQKADGVGVELMAVAIQRVVRALTHARAPRQQRRRRRKSCCCNARLRQ